MEIRNNKVAGVFGLGTVFNLFLSKVKGGDEDGFRYAMIAFSSNWMIKRWRCERLWPKSKGQEENLVATTLYPVMLVISETHVLME